MLHDPKNLKYLAFDIHTDKSNFWRDNIGDAGEKFFKGRDLSTLPKLKAAAREYAALIKRSNKIVQMANAQYKTLNKTDISQEELEEFISRLGSDPLQSKYNIKQVKAILQQMEDDGFLVKPETTQAEETKVIKTEQKTAKAKADKAAKIDKEFQKSVVESETYRKYYASDEGKFKSPLVKGSKDDMLITHAEDIYEEMSVDKNPDTKDAMIKKIMKIIKTKLKDCFVVEPDIFEDERGFFLETYNKDKYKKIDVLVNSAGVRLSGNLETTTMNDWSYHLNNNVTGTFLSCKHILPFLKKAKNSSIINLASINSVRGVKNMLAYATSKSCLLYTSPSPRDRG